MKPWAWLGCLDYSKKDEDEDGWFPCSCAYNEVPPLSSVEDERQIHKNSLPGYFHFDPNTMLYSRRLWAMSLCAGKEHVLTLQINSRRHPAALVWQIQNSPSALGLSSWLWLYPLIPHERSDAFWASDLWAELIKPYWLTYVNIIALYSILNTVNK